MTRRAIEATLDEAAIAHLDTRAAQLCVSRSVLIEALTRADMAGAVAELAERAAEVHATVKAGEAARMRAVQHLGAASRRKREG